MAGAENGEGSASTSAGAGASGTASGHAWVTISEAAARTGRNIETVRAAVKKRRIAAQKNNRGEWLVQPAEVMTKVLPPVSALGLLGPHPRADTSIEDDAAPVRLVQELTEELRRTRELLDQAKEEATGSKIEAARLAAQVEAKEQLVVELKAMLAERLAELRETRKPWWARWLGR